MRWFSRWGRTAGVGACVCAVIATAACGSDGASSSPTASTVTVTQSISGSTAPSESSTPAAESDDVTGTVDEQPPATVQKTAAAVIAKYPKDANVNARNFYGPGAGVNAYFFQSPSGNVRCGIHFDGAGIPGGCQAQKSIRSTGGLTCRNDEGSQYSVQLRGDVAVNKCVNQPFFVGGSGKPGEGVVGGRVLQYGEIISSGGTTCESTTFGISCWNASVGFTLSRDYNTYYGQGSS